MMSEMAEYQAVVRRLEKIEKQNRWFRVAGIIVLLMLFSLLLMGQAAPGNRSIEAQEFVLRDSSGKVRAKLSAIDNSSTLSLYDSDENVRARLAAANNGSVLALFDAGRRGSYAKLRLALGVGDMGGGVMIPALIFSCSMPKEEAEPNCM